MQRIAIFIWVILLLPTIQTGAQISDESYIDVKIIKGDNLWNLSRRFYNTGQEYMKIWENRLDSNLSKSPNLVYPGMRFRFQTTKVKQNNPLLNLEIFDKIYNTEEQVSKSVEHIAKNTDTIKNVQKEIANSVNTNFWSTISLGVLSGIIVELIVAFVGGLIVKLGFDYYLRKKGWIEDERQILS